MSAPVPTSTVIVLDTNVLLHVFFYKYQPALIWFNSLGNTEIAIPGISIVELLNNPRKRDLLIIQNFLSNFKVYWPTEQDGKRAFTNVMTFYGAPRLGFADALVAEVALRLNAPLCTCDNDFNIIPNLQVISPYRCP